MIQANNMGIFKWEDMFVYRSGNTPFAEDVIEMNTLHFNADLVFVLKDAFPFEQIMYMPLEQLWYVPVDHYPLSPSVGFRLKSAFRVVAMSNFGEKALRSMNIRVDDVIPHGYDPEIYFPRHGIDKDNSKRFFHVPLNVFTVGFIGMNRTRKMVPRVLQAFKRLLEISEDKEIHMLLWTNIEKETPLLPMMRDLGLSAHVHWPDVLFYNMGIPERDMGRFYNAVDCLICVSGEGFWLPGLEAEASGTPIVVPDYAAAPELIGSGYKAKVEDWTYNNEVGVRQPLVDLDDMAEKILKIKDGDREKFREEAVKFAKPYTWKEIVERKWVPLLERAEEELRPMITKEKGITRWDVELG